MPPIRRTLLAALWGMPGPVIAGCLIALALSYANARSGIRPGVSGAISILTVEPGPESPRFWLGLAIDATFFWWLPVGEGLAGALYGLSRSLAVGRDYDVLNLKRTAGMCSTIWILLGWLPFFLLVGGVGRAWGICSSDPLALLDIGVASYGLHVFGGAIAGFHVEHFLLRSHEPERAAP